MRLASTLISEIFTPTCSVVICTRNRPKELEQCLESVTRLDYPSVEVLVVDNAPRSEAAREVAGRFGVGYVVEPVVGLSRARNLGARASRGDIVAFTDDDALPEPDWLCSLVREFQDPQVMAVAGRVLPFGVETESKLSHAQMSRCGERLVVDQDTPFWFEMANFGGIGDGGNMAFRREVFVAWPGFDIRLGRGACLSGGEDNRAFCQMIERGWRVVYTPEAIVRHPYPLTFRDLSDQHRKTVAMGAAYATFLFVEQPGHRRALLQYVARSLNGGQPWQSDIARTRRRMFPRWHKLLACLAGPALYLRSLFPESSFANNGSDRLPEVLRARFKPNPER